MNLENVAAELCEDKTINNFVLNQSKKVFSNQCDYDMVVFCHLRWDFVYQRPQHIISRFSHELKVLFVEEPVDRIEKGSLVFEVNPNLHVFQPNISDLTKLPDLLSKFFRINNTAIAWFYSPSFVGVLSEFLFSLVVYDCMDELSLFKGASSELIFQEKLLLSRASIVFTGGKSLFEAKSILHPNVFCFPSSVDIAHFSKAKNGISIPSELSSIPSPVIGYFGVLDERLDFELIRKTAEILPKCSFVFIGPVVKIGMEELPRLTNIHYLGIKPYTQLPYYLKGFDIAMMPFALNESTRFISPTKTLEYMSAGKPIISTAIKDVVRDYSSIVKFISSADDFAFEVKRILADEAQKMNDHYEAILKRTSWDITVSSMKSIINETIEK
ncbi:glycosyltransferase [Belliella sp. DSM 111904]|uniref:Glycosyltransferase n=1 Tax=Belliella filtrata TaxID=2923435 RepID=A0ABS9UW89_9BACT|nr:glycosyltransferase [Belliella filtrata]MCH7408431.1 glycosyltransferase [Belliella filtrata]